jgi:hypothetical protein
MDPVPDPLLLRKPVSAGESNLDLWICSQELLPLYHRGGPLEMDIPYFSIQALKVCSASSRNSWISVREHQTLTKDGLRLRDAWWMRLGELSEKTKRWILTRKYKRKVRTIRQNNAEIILRGSVVGWGIMLQAGRSRVRDPMRSLNFFNLLHPSGRTRL